MKSWWSKVWEWWVRVWEEWVRSKRVCRNCNITPLLASEGPTENSKISTWFSNDIGENIVIIFEGWVFTNFIDEAFKETSFLSLLPFLLGRGDWYGLSETSSFGFFDCFRFGGVQVVRESWKWWGFLLDMWGVAKRRTRGRLVILRAGKGSMTWWYA